ncbi:MAG: hypothetical protein M2R45_05379 [Verrucomicrobia subdivision 3 bacterium]|nr:hypothetical protein [Limisphaerales bacterium]
MLGEQGEFDGFGESELSDQPVASGVLALAAAVWADCELVQGDGVTVFEDFRVGDAGVGHVGVDTAGAVKGVGGASAAADGFVVADAIVPEDEVVHGALAACGQPQGFDQGVHNSLAGFDVAGRNCGAGTWIVRKFGIEK